MITIMQSGAEMDRKVASLKKIKIDADNYCTYYLDEQTGEKWIKRLM